MLSCLPVPHHTNKWKQMEKTEQNACPAWQHRNKWKQMQAYSQVQHARGRIQRHGQAARPSEVAQLVRAFFGSLEHFVQRSAGAVLCRREA